MWKSLAIAVLFVLTPLVPVTQSFAQSDSKQKSERPKRPPTERRARMNRDSGLKVGQLAPSFKLKSLDGKSETDLDVLRKNKPVVLMFGSYT